MHIDGNQGKHAYKQREPVPFEIWIESMSKNTRAKNSALIANMRQSVGRAVGLAGLTVAVSLPAATVQTADAQEKRDVTRSLQQVQKAVKAAPVTAGTTRPGGKMAQWQNWNNWNNWRNY